MGRTPRVSIGVPVYNARRFLGATLDSLLGQDFQDLELVISDNASSDGSEELCRSYAARDPRVRYVRSPVNRGAVFNFNNALLLCSGEYFMWGSDHDVWDRSYVRRCAEVLDREPEVVLAFSRARMIDMDGASLGGMRDELDTRGMGPLQRYLHLMWNMHTCNAVHGLLRRRALVALGGSGSLWGGDHLLLAQLALSGQFAQLPEQLFLRRRNRPDEEGDAWKARVAHALDPARASELSARSFQELFHILRAAHLRAVWSASQLGPLEKAWASCATVACFHTKFGVRVPGAPVVKRSVTALGARVPALARIWEGTLQVLEGASPLSRRTSSSPPAPR